MLVYISKGLVNVQQNLVGAVLDKGLVQDSNHISTYQITLSTRVDVATDGSPLETVFKYGLSEEDEYRKDFQLLKDCFLNICRQNNISVFNETAGHNINMSMPRPTTVISSANWSTFQEPSEEDDSSP